MTTKISTKRLRTNLVLILTIICLICSCMFGLFACDNQDITVTDPTVTVDTESKDVLIKNATFKIETANKELKNFPLISPNGWSRSSTDNSATSSTVSSGVINTSTAGFEALLNTLYDDSDFLAYIRKLDNFNDTKVTDKFKADNNDKTPTKDEIKQLAVSEFIKSFTNPSVAPGAKDKYVYMLNNIAKSSNYGIGTAQKITSSSTVSMTKGKVYELSVWVKTANITGVNDGNVGANIRLTNNLNGKAQADYKVSNIIANDWTKYSFFVKADADYNCTFTLVLGLGYGNGNSNDVTYLTEGTAFFDEISIKEVSDYTLPTNADILQYGSEDAIEANLVEKTENNTTSYECYYDMTFANSEINFFDDIDISKTENFSSDFTKSNVTVDDGNGGEIPLTSAVKVGAESTQTLTIDGKVAKMVVNKASSTITLKDSAFSLANGKYALVSFYVKNNLVAPARTDVFVDVWDKLGDTVIKNPAVITVKNTEEDYTRYLLLVKNNYKTGDNREFYIDFVVGPNDIASVKYNSDFSTGEVLIKNLSINVGDIENEDKLFAYFSSIANATVALHAGYENDYKDDSSSTSYDFTTRPGNFGDILFNPTTIKGYTGIVPNHAYITNADGAETKVNTRINAGTADGVAGLINTKYLSEYNNGLEIKNKIGAYEDDFQAIMINNKTENNYGFVGEKLQVSASNNAKISVSLRVVDNAKAYVYLVDVTGVNKKVLTFDDFTVNTDVVSGVDKNTNVDGSTLKYALEITSDMMNADGWVDLSFYIGAGNSSKSFRVEVWNGDRDGVEKSSGYVFVKNITTTLSSGFSEGAKWNQTFTTSGNPLYEHHKASFTTLYAYERQLTEIEKAFNADYPDKTVSYQTNYVWAQSKTVVYGVYNTIDPVAKNPYDDIEEETPVESGCTVSSNPSTFWLGFSSIILAVALVIAIITLIIKRVRAKIRANKSDAKSHYKVTSRISNKKVDKQAKVKNVKTEEIEETIDETVEETQEEVVEETVEETETEETENAETTESDEYVYGEVQSFDEENKVETEQETETETKTDTEQKED